MTTVPVPETLEPVLLDYFWQMSAKPDTDRLELLQVIGCIVIQRPPTWDRAAVRAAIGWTGLAKDQCFACRTVDRELQQHHVIWVNNGGSNTKRNYVPLCQRCHETVHGFALYGQSSQGRGQGWSRLQDLFGSIAVERKRERA